jgi:hypothetical protein
LKTLGNYIDTFVKGMFGRVLVFADFLVSYADPKFVAEIDITKIKPAPTHYVGKSGHERIVDLVFQCPLKDGRGDLMAVIIFEHQGGSLKKIPRKLHKYISGIWEAETKEGKKVLSAPYFIVLRTGKRLHRGPFPKMSDSLPKDRNGKPLGHVPEIKYDVFDLPAWDFKNLVGGPVLRLALGILKKMLEEGGDELSEAFLPLLEIADEEEQVELTKELLNFVAKAFAVYDRPLDAETVSKVLKPVFKDKEQTMIKTIFEEREAIGEARGEARGKADIVLLLLQKKFHKVPKRVEEAVRSMTDPTALESLAAHVVDCQSLEEFEKALH